MTGDENNLGSCPVDRGLMRVGDRWSILILRDLDRGLTRYEQLRTSLGIAPNILSRRLATLTEAGLIAKRRYSQRPPRDEYLLTEAGRDFLPILAAIGAWGRKHNGAGALTRQIDVETGAAIRPVVVDANTGAPLGSRPLKFEYPE
ncbi:transcriptional regulator [Sphingopyxis sp. H050]|jgi:DNA-binding HxlR family transcriptional regulator|uniref:winged helix-turn-helix transcriptional regulator n=1 Tax=Sphingopyxis sp. H050 TaxID=1759072 RepID=UPI0007361846|nr:helix-turn-helix domain-containing protein [Sphingopyxis sp. H050]KTE21231.1 transcriptional regulator [Sphingopyxis sp. H050]